MRNDMWIRNRKRMFRCGHGDLHQVRDAFSLPTCDILVHEILEPYISLAFDSRYTV